MDLQQKKSSQLLKTENIKTTFSLINDDDIDIDIIYGFYTYQFLFTYMLIHSNMVISLTFIKKSSEFIFFNSSN